MLNFYVVKYPTDKTKNKTKMLHDLTIDYIKPYDQSCAQRSKKLRVWAHWEIYVCKWFSFDYIVI